MKVGLLLPQGYFNEFDGWDPVKAWKRVLEVSQLGARLGFESIWLFDHFHTVPRPTDEITFESFTSLSALKVSDIAISSGDGGEGLAFVRVSLVGIDLITVEARVVVASIDTYIKYSEAVGQVVPGSRPAIDSRTHDAVLAENAALRAQIAAQAAPREEVVTTRRRRKTAGGG